MRDRFLGVGQHPGGSADAAEHDEVQGSDAGGAFKLPGKIEGAQCCFAGEDLDCEAVLQVFLDVLHDGMNALQQAFHTFLATCD